MELQTIRLYGVLGTKFGRSFKLSVSSAAEAIGALCTQLPGFEKFLANSQQKGIGYAIFYGKRNLAKDELSNANNEREIKIAPMILGSKRGGIFQILLGAVLIVVGVALTLAFPVLGPLLVKLGAGLVVGGISQLLTPIPKDNGGKDKPENKPSYNFNGPVNTQAQGNPFQLLYGKLMVGSAVLSAGINPVEQVYIPSNTSGGAGPVTGGGGVIGGPVGDVPYAVE